MSIRERLRAWWTARQRATDLRILWPSCLSQAPSYELAEAAFLGHAGLDPAWDEFETREIKRILGREADRLAGFPVEQGEES